MLQTSPHRMKGHLPVPFTPDLPSNNHPINSCAEKLYWDSSLSSNPSTTTPTPHQSTSTAVSKPPQHHHVNTYQTTVASTNLISNATQPDCPTYSTESHQPKYHDHNNQQICLPLAFWALQTTSFAGTTKNNFQLYLTHRPHTAAIKIQHMTQRVLTRRHAAITIQCLFRRRTSRLQLTSLEHQQFTDSWDIIGTATLQQSTGNKRRLTLPRRYLIQDSAIIHLAALIIQHTYHGHKVRTLYRQQQQACSTIQSWFRTLPRRPTTSATTETTPTTLSSYDLLKRLARSSHPTTRTTTTTPYQSMLKEMNKWKQQPSILELKLRHHTHTTSFY